MEPKTLSQCKELGHKIVTHTFGEGDETTSLSYCRTCQQYHVQVGDIKHRWERWHKAVDGKRNVDSEIGE